VPDLTLPSLPAAEAAVLRAAAQARVALPAGAAADVAVWLRSAVAELAGALAGARPGPEGVAVGVGAGGMPLRPDAGPPLLMQRPLALVVPASRLGFVLVPRLAPEPVSTTPGVRHAGDDARADDAFAAELAVGA
jgi:hypothetical protein